MPKCDSFTKYIPATVAWVLLLGTTTLFFYFPCRDYLPDFPWIPAYQGVITLFVIANFTLATFMDPGVIPRASPEEDREDDFRAPLYKNVEINGITVRMKWCVTCQFYRPPRCSHCSVCNVCIETFDHHCPWVNNCIGRRNYRFFFMFLISLSLHMTSIFTLCLVYVLGHKTDLTKVETIVAMVLMGIIVLLVIPIYGLTGFHMVLVSRGRTTNEQVTGKFKGGYNPFSRGCSRNCCYILCGPQYPSLLNASKYVGKPKRYPLSASAISTITSENQRNVSRPGASRPVSSQPKQHGSSETKIPVKQIHESAKGDNLILGETEQINTDREVSVMGIESDIDNIVATSTPGLAWVCEDAPLTPVTKSVQIQTSDDEHVIQKHVREAVTQSRALKVTNLPDITITPRMYVSNQARFSDESDIGSDVNSKQKLVDEYSSFSRQRTDKQRGDYRSCQIQKNRLSTKGKRLSISEDIQPKLAWLPETENVLKKAVKSDHG